MKGKEFGAHQVIARSNTRRHGEVRPATISDHIVDAPFTAVEAVR